MVQKKIQIIGIPMDLGQMHRGVCMGPGAVRYSGLSRKLRNLGFQVSDIGDIQVPVRNALPEPCNNRFVTEIRRTCTLVYNAARKAIEEGCIPIFLGGDHSISIGTIGGITHNVESGVIWIDAHGDFNTPQTSATGNIHGMPLAVLLGHGFPELVNIGRPGSKLKPENVIIIGVRNLDPEERILLKNSGIKIFTMRDIDEHGINNIAHVAVAKLKHLSSIHVSFDIDSIDPMTAPGVGTPALGGLTYREAHLLMEIIADSQSLSSIDIVEINPMLDHKNQTALIAVDLAVSAFGKRIL